MEHILLIALIIFGEFAPADAHLFANTLEGIPLTSIQIIVLIENFDWMEKFLVSQHISATVLRHETVITRSTVVAIKMIELDDLNQLTGISRARGISA